MNGSMARVSAADEGFTGFAPFDSAAALQRLQGAQPGDLGDLSAFASHYMVAHGEQLGVEGLLDGFPRWLTPGYLKDARNKISHDVFRILAERLKDHLGDQSPWAIKEAVYRAVNFDDIVTGLMRLQSSIPRGLKWTSKLGNWITRDQYVDAAVTEKKGKRQRGMTKHYFLRQQEDTYFEQTTATFFYYEAFPWLWRHVIENISPMAVTHAVSRFSPEKLLGDDFAYAAEALGIEQVERDSEGNLRINEAIFGTPVSADDLHETWQFDTQYTGASDSRPIRITQPLEHDGEIILPQGLILDAPASIYTWDCPDLPWSTAGKVVWHSLRRRARPTKALVEAGQSEMQERGQKETAQRKYEVSERTLRNILIQFHHETGGEIGDSARDLERVEGDIEAVIQYFVAQNTSAEARDKAIKHLLLAQKRLVRGRDAVDHFFTAADAMYLRITGHLQSKRRRENLVELAQTFVEGRKRVVHAYSVESALMSDAKVQEQRGMPVYVGDPDANIPVQIEPKTWRILWRNLFSNATDPGKGDCKQLEVTAHYRKYGGDDPTHHGKTYPCFTTREIDGLGVSEKLRQDLLYGMEEDAGQGSDTHEGHRHMLYAIRDVHGGLIEIESVQRGDGTDKTGNTGTTYHVYFPPQE